MSPTPSSAPKRISVTTATGLVVANMIGTGVFTSLGFQVADFKSPTVLLLLWIVGGVGALAGALCYGRLGSLMPRSGGEYHFLSRIYHPAAGFLSGWVSLTVGFAAPIALAAMALAAYSSRIFDLAHPRLFAAFVIVAVAMVHAGGLTAGARFQMTATILKVLLIVGFIVAGLLFAPAQPLDLLPAASDGAEILSGAFAVSLVYVSFAYSGWNAAAYVADEVDDPSRNLPRALLAGTALVTVLYVLLNYTFLRSTPLHELSGQLEVGYIAGARIFGAQGGRIVAGLIAFGLVSTISAMTWVGPRVAQVMGQDLPPLRFLARTSDSGAPIVAIAFQTAIVLLLLFTSTFEAVLTWLGFTLALSTVLAVFGLFVLRRRDSTGGESWRGWGFPVTPLLFLAINVWMLIFILKNRPMESLAGIGVVLAGLLLYYPASRGDRR